MSQIPPHPITKLARVVELTESERHTLLANERRRLALDVLAEQATPIELADLAVAVAARENGLDTTDEDAIERVTITLHHAHLPLMDDFGVLDYDVDSNWIEL